MSFAKQKKVVFMARLNNTFTLPKNTTFLIIPLTSHRLRIKLGKAGVELSF